MYPHLFAPTLPDWQSFKKLNENKNISEAELVQKYKKLSLAQDRMIEESMYQINMHNEALINAQGGGSGASASGGSANTAKILSIQQYAGTVQNNTGFYRYTAGFTGATEASVEVNFDRNVEVDPDVEGIPAFVANNDQAGRGTNSQVIFSYDSAGSVNKQVLAFAYSQSSQAALSITVATSQVDTTDNNIQFTGGTNLYKQGNQVQYSAEGGTVMAGLVDGGVYYILEGDTPAAQFKLVADQSAAGNPFNQNPALLNPVNITGTGNNSQTFKCLSPFVSANTIGIADAANLFTGTGQRDGGAVFTNMNSGSFSGSFSASAFFSSSNRLYASESAVWIVSASVDASRNLVFVSASTHPTETNPLRYVQIADTLDLPDNFLGNQNSGSRVTITQQMFVSGGNDQLTFNPNSIWTKEVPGHEAYPGVGGHIVDEADQEAANLTYGAPQITAPNTRAILVV